MSESKERVINVLVEVKPAINDHIDEETFISEGVLDSYDIMQLIMKLEEEFDIEIDPEDVLSENFESVDKIVALVEKCSA